MQFPSWKWGDQANYNNDKMYTNLASLVNQKTNKEEDLHQGTNNRVYIKQKEK